MRLSKALFVVVVTAATASAPAAFIAMDTPKTKRVVGVGYDAARERETFEAYKARASSLLGDDLSQVSFEFIPINASSDEDVLSKTRQIILDNPSVVVAGNWVLARAFLRTSKSLPVIFLSMAEPVDVGLVEQEGWPRANASGVTLAAPIVTVQLDWLIQALPKAKRILVVTDKWWEENRAAGDLRTHLDSHKQLQYDFRRVDSVEGAIALMKEVGPTDYDAWFFPAGFAVFVAANEWMVHIRENKIAAAFNSENWGDDVGLVTYQEDRTRFRDRIGEYIYAVLTGRQTSDMAVDRPVKFRLTANLRRANELGITLPPRVLYSADKIVR